MNKRHFIKTIDGITCFRICWPLIHQRFLDRHSCVEWCVNASCMIDHELEASVSVFGKQNEYINFIAPIKTTCLPYLRGPSFPVHHLCCYCGGGSMWPQELGGHSFSFIILILLNYCQVFSSTASYHFPLTIYVLCKHVTKCSPFSRKGNLSSASWREECQRICG